MSVSHDSFETMLSVSCGYGAKHSAHGRIAANQDDGQDPANGNEQSLTEFSHVVHGIS